MKPHIRVTFLFYYLYLSLRLRMIVSIVTIGMVLAVNGQVAWYIIINWLFVLLMLLLHAVLYYKIIAY